MSPTLDSATPLFAHHNPKREAGSRLLRLVFGWSLIDFVDYKRLNWNTHPNHLQSNPRNRRRP